MALLQVKKLSVFLLTSFYKGLLDINCTWTDAPEEAGMLLGFISNP